MLFRILIPSALVASCAAILRPDNHVVHERRTPWQASSKRIRASSEALIPLKIGLLQRNLEQGYDYLLDVSHPSSPNYGKHWNSDEVNAMFGPADDTVEAVKDWLIRSGISSDTIAYSHQGWLSIEVPVHQAEELLRTEYYEQPYEDGSVRLGCDEYSLPQQIAQYVDYIKPGVNLSPPLKKRTVQPASGLRGGPLVSPYIPSAGPIPTATQNLPQDLQNCSQYITPPCVMALYDISRPDSANSSSALGIYETGGAYSQDDLSIFFASFAPAIPSDTEPTDYSVDGGIAPASNSSDVSTEANIDLQIAYSIVYPNSVVNYQDANPVTSESNYSWVTTILDAVDGSFCSQNESQAGFDCGKFNLTSVLTSSYAATELTTYSLAAQTRACNEFMKLGLQGHTFVYSSGDWGVAFGPNSATGQNGCYDPSTKNNTNGTLFNPSFPSNCPYVLSVGATQIETGNTVYDPEGALEQSGAFSSSGGFSNYFATPAYQRSAVDAYFANSNLSYPSYQSNGLDVSTGGSNIGENGGIFSRAGRGYPDVSANGANFAFILNGGTYIASGTSLSTPVWASIITLINSNRTAEGKSPVGFINPVLYENPGAFNDITIGNNPGCGTNGFTAVPGWDPITGLGTPNFPVLMDIFASLQ